VEAEKSRVVRNDSHVVSGQKFLGERGRVRCDFVKQQAVSVAKVRGEVFAHFNAVVQNVTAVCGTDSSACQDEIFVNNSLDVKENDEHALDFAVHLSRPFQSQ
jgi:hypothetical protein